MAIIGDENNPHTIDKSQYDYDWIYKWNAGIGYRSRRRKLLTTRSYAWPADDAGGETTHEATYGTGGFELHRYGPERGYGRPNGIWREEYRMYGTYEYLNWAYSTGEDDAWGTWAELQPWAS